MSTARRGVRMSVAALLSLVVATLAVGLIGVEAADAHPLGNFTVNRYARVEISAGVVRVHYVLDEAEIPAFQDRDELRADREAFARNRSAAIADGLELTLDGTAAPLRVVDSLLTEPDGQGGLPTLRLEVTLEATLAASDGTEPVRATFTDGNEPARIGWREIVVIARGDARVLSSDAPAVDVSNELRDYPGDQLKAPLDLRSAMFQFSQGSERVAAAPLASSSVDVERSGSDFTELVGREDVTTFALAGMLGVALLFGAVHALSPGHGKTVMAAYLVGTRGRPRDALLLGVIVSAMHTTSVLVLGLILFRVSREASLDRIFPWLEVLSGVLVTGVGIWLLRSRLRGMGIRRRRAPHEHGHDAAHDHDHGHGHGHAHDHAHDHAHGHGHGHGHGPGGHTHELPEGTPPLSRRGLALLAAAGGVLPSPSAVVVLVGAFSLGRAGLGLLLVLAFSVGLAATLTAVGLALVFGKSAVERSPRFRSSIPALSVASALAIAVAGSVVLVRGVSTLS